ncbi:MAG TPA: methyltransferase [Gaiellaceae bacterium]|jgi:methylase of polypeptide subunit release factors|nr:methyltransferase [Gaiellaceae bacterium]
MARHPIADTGAARTLGKALRDVGYSEEAITELLGDEAYSSRAGDVPISARRLSRSKLDSVVRLLFLQLPLPVDDAIAALGPRGVDALAATALADVDGKAVVPRARLLPIGELLVAADNDLDEDGHGAPDYVAGYTPTSQLCDSLTPRRRVSRALDVGTGSGVQALLAAAHAREVVATDVNPRALAYTELNAALNGLSNIECRSGSLFEPVADETFDLITCNAPYVVSPEHRWAYRDGGLGGDELSQQLVGTAAAHLADDGFATLLVSWIAPDEDSSVERPLEWLEPLDCDGWILPIWESDALEHAATWNDHLVDDSVQLGDALDAWTEYLTAIGAHWIGEGAVVLHRRPAPHSIRVDWVDADELEDAGDQILRAFDARERLAGLGRKRELLDRRVSLAASLKLAQDLRRRDGRNRVFAAEIQLDEGTHSLVETAPDVLDVVAALDGSRRVGDVVDSVARKRRLSERESTRLRRRTQRVVRELLELGALRFE